MSILSLLLGWTHYVSYVEVNIGGKLSRPITVPYEIRINRYTKRVQKVTSGPANNGGLYDMV